MNNSQVNNIELKDSAVCFDGNEQWFALIENGQLISVCGSYGAYYDDLIGNDNFQLNTIKQGDYIAASELDTEQKYNNAVDVFGLLGFYRVGEFALDYEQFMNHPNEDSLVCSESLLMGVNSTHDYCKRKLTYPQIMAIGELKRLEVERNNTVLSLDEETELKSRAMASELNSQSNDDEWPQVGDEVCWSNGCYNGVVKARHWNDLWVMESDGEFSTLYIDDVSKPKTPEDLLIEELQTKLVKNNAVDNWMLAANIISGDIEGLTYNSKDGK